MPPRTSRSRRRRTSKGSARRSRRSRRRLSRRLSSTRTTRRRSFTGKIVTVTPARHYRGKWSCTVPLEDNPPFDVQTPPGVECTRITDSFVTPRQPRAPRSPVPTLTISRDVVSQLNSITARDTRYVTRLRDVVKKNVFERFQTAYEFDKLDFINLIGRLWVFDGTGSERQANVPDAPVYYTFDTNNPDGAWKKIHAWPWKEGKVFIIGNGGTAGRGWISYLKKDLPSDVVLVWHGADSNQNFNSIGFVHAAITYEPHIETRLKKANIIKENVQTVFIGKLALVVPKRLSDTVEQLSNSLDSTVGDHEHIGYIVVTLLMQHGLRFATRSNHSAMAEHDFMAIVMGSQRWATEKNMTLREVLEQIEPTIERRPKDFPGDIMKYQRENSNICHIQDMAFVTQEDKSNSSNVYVDTTRTLDNPAQLWFRENHGNPKEEILRTAVETSIATFASGMPDTMERDVDRTSSAQQTYNETMCTCIDADADYWLTWMLKTSPRGNLAPEGIRRAIQSNGSILPQQFCSV